jgi:hypothetical protein
VSTWVLGEFGDKHEMLGALKGLKAHGFERLDTYTPFPVDEVAEILDLPHSWVRWFALFGGLAGAAFGYGIQWYCNAVDFRILVGARPFHAIPSFIPITFESAVLCSAFAIFFSALAHFGLPRIDHPVFELAQFESATIDGFWVSVSADSHADAERAQAQLRQLGARHTSLVEGDEE